MVPIDVEQRGAWLVDMRIFDQNICICYLRSERINKRKQMSTKAVN